MGQTTGGPNGASSGRELPTLPPSEMDHLTMAARVDVSKLAPPEVLHLQSRAEQHERYFRRSAGGEQSGFVGRANDRDVSAVDVNRGDVDTVEMSVTVDVTDMDAAEKARLTDEANLREAQLLDTFEEMRADE